MEENEAVTCDTILDWIEAQIAAKNPISPQIWMDAAIKLNILSSDEVDKLIEMRQKVAVLTAGAKATEKTAVGAKLVVETLPEYAELQRQEAKLERIQETVRLAKKIATLKSEEMRSGL